MALCLPGMPCYQQTTSDCDECNHVYITYPYSCTRECVPISSDCVTYTGANLVNSNIEYGDTLTVALQKLDESISSGGFTLTNGNGTTVGSNSTSVDLGGPLTADVAITGAYRFDIGTTSSKLFAFLSEVGGSGSTILFTQSEGGITRRFGLADGIGVILDLGSDATGDMYQRNGGVVVRIPSVVTGNVLLSGGVGVINSWGKVGLTTHVSGTLPVGNGGTGLTTIAARSIWVTNVTDTITTVTPGAGQSIRINAGNTAWEAYTPGSGGITNGAANTELMMSNGTNAVSSGLFTPSASGNLFMGIGLSGSQRQITASGSATNVELILQSKGASPVTIISPTGQITMYAGGAVFITASPTSNGGITIISDGSNYERLVSNAITTTFEVGAAGRGSSALDGQHLSIFGGAGGVGIGATFGGNVSIASGVPDGGGAEGAVNIQTRSTGKIGFYNTTAIVQPTTAIASATLVLNASVGIYDLTTFDGYTIAQVVKALRNLGLLQ